MEFVTALVFIFIACQSENSSQNMKESQDFLREQYTDCSVFLAIMAGLLIFISPWSSLAFVLRAATSMLCGYLGMAIATAANFRTAFSAITSLGNAFQMAYRGGCVMGFLLVSISLSILILIIIIYNAIIVKSDENNFEDLVTMFDYVAAYGLGGSTIALFGRVLVEVFTQRQQIYEQIQQEKQRIIYQKIVQKIQQQQQIMQVILLVWELTYLVLLLNLLVQHWLFHLLNQELYKMILMLLNRLVDVCINGLSLWYWNLYFGISLCCLCIKSKSHQQNRIHFEILTIIINNSIISNYYWYAADNSIQLSELKSWHAFLCSLMGLWSVLLIGYFTEYMTSHSYKPVREVAKLCGTGAATNIIYGLALGYLSTIVPIVAIAITALLSMKMLSFYGVALAALGMLSNLTIGLAIDSYGPISDNAGGIAEMSELGENVRESTDALNAAGNTTAAIGKGFAIGSAALVSLSLYGGYLTRIQTYKVGDEFPYAEGAKIDDPIIFAMLLIDAMLSYAFSAFTMKSVGIIIISFYTFTFFFIYSIDLFYKNQLIYLDMNIQVSMQKQKNQISGLFFGPYAVAGLQPGPLVSGVQNGYFSFQYRRSLRQCQKLH